LRSSHRRSAQRAGELSSSSSRDLSLPSRVFPPGRRQARPQGLGLDCLPYGFFPFGVFPVAGRRLAEVVTPLIPLPSQRFSRSQGLTPPATCRPCFMPVPPLGFFPEDSPGREAVHPLEWSCPPVVRIPAVSLLHIALPMSHQEHPWYSSDTFMKHRTNRYAPLQDFVPRVRPCALEPAVKPEREPEPSGFFTSSGASLSVPGPSCRSPLLSFNPGLRTNQNRLFRVFPARRSAWLLRACRPSRGFPTFPASSRFVVSSLGGTPPGRCDVTIDPWPFFELQQPLP
jgi:hypothetical protein